MKADQHDSPSLKIHTSRAGMVQLSGPSVAAACVPAHRREFIDRLFAVPTLLNLRFSGKLDRVHLAFQPGGAQLSETLDGLAAAMRNADPGAWVLPNDSHIFTLTAGHPLDVFRVGQRLSFWRIDSLAEEYYRCAHPLVRYEPVRKRILEDLATLAGVEEEKASRWLPDCLLIRTQAHRVTPEHLLDVLEPAIKRGLEEVELRPLEISPRRAVINMNLTLAPISDYLAPEIGYLNAVCTTLLNYRNVGQAFRAIRKGRIGMSALHSAMYFMGLIAFEFLGDAVMYWTSEFWPRQVARLRREVQRQFLARYRRYPRRVWVERGGAGAQVEIPLSDLEQGEVIVLRHGDIIPGDGVVVGGKGGVRESWITGVEGEVKKGVRDHVYASCEVCDGELRVRMEAMGAQTLAAQLAEWFEKSFEQPHPRQRAHDFGETMALPSLALTLAALPRGGIPMAKAVGHPDYRSGPGIATELGDVAVTLQAGSLGVYIASPDALAEIADADCFVIDDSAAAWFVDGESETTVGERLRSMGVKEVVLISHRESEDIAHLAEKIGADSFLGKRSAVDKTDFIRERQMFETRVVYFGDLGPDAEVAAAAQVSVTAVGAAGQGKKLPNSGVVLRQPDLEKAVLLRAMAMESRQNHRGGVSTALTVNAACVLGALFLNFPILAVVGLTNVGTFWSYRTAVRRLRKTAEQTMQEHKLRVRVR